MPGIVKDDVTIWCFNLGWEDVNVKQLIGDLFPGVPIHVENDANLAGLGETHALTKLPKSSLYVTISTGIGTGVIEDGYIDPALRGSEGGHMMFEFDDELQIWEHFASGKAIYKHYNKYASEIDSDEEWQPYLIPYEPWFLGDDPDDPARHYYYWRQYRYVFRALSRIISSRFWKINYPLTYRARRLLPRAP